MSDFEIIKLLPRKQRQREFYAKIVDILQNFDDSERENFKNVLLKYKDPKDIDYDAAKEVVNELGYDYITDIISLLSEEDVGNLVSYIGFISLFKGTKTGLETVFDLLGFSYDIIEWWEYSKDRKKGTLPDSPLLDVDEWKLAINILESTNLSNIQASVPLLHKFSRNYVYPLLACLELIFKGIIDDVNISIHGAVDKNIGSELIDDIHKIITVHGSINLNSLSLLYQVEPLAGTFDNLLLLEKTELYIYTENKQLLKLN